MTLIRPGTWDAARRRSSTSAATCSSAPSTSTRGRGLVPHFAGFADETGTGDGEGANRNLPLASSTGDELWLDAVKELAEWARAKGAMSLVVPLGVDAAAGDPESPLRVTATGLPSRGAPSRRVGITDGARPRRGYDLESLG